MTTPTTAPAVRTVRCPACGGPSRYAADNPWRPFCSERCKNLDFGAWASENYRVATQHSVEGEDGGESSGPTSGSGGEPTSH